MSSRGDDNVVTVMMTIMMMVTATICRKRIKSRRSVHVRCTCKVGVKWRGRLRLKTAERPRSAVQTEVYRLSA